MLKTQHFILIKEARWISRSTKTEQNPKEEHEATFCPLFAWSEICYPLPSHKQRESLHLSASRWHPPAWEGAYSAERRIFTQTTETKDKATQNKKKNTSRWWWAQTGAAEVCELGRSVGQSLAPSPGREGAALHGDSPSLSGQRHYAAVSVEQWSHQTQITFFIVTYPTLPAARGPEVLYTLPL